MKRCLTALTVVVVLMCAQFSSGGIKPGAFVGASLGGDVEEVNVHYGVQCIVPFGETFSGELGLSSLTDSDNGFDLDIWNVAASGRASFPCAQMFGDGVDQIFPVAESTSLYVGGGLAYNFYSGDASDLDDNLGFQVFTGLEFDTGQFGEMFLEFRFNFIELEDGGFDESHNMGAARIGASFVF